MHVPVVIIDRIGELDRKVIRTELRRALFSAYEVDKLVVVLSGRIDYIRQIAMRYAIVGVPRCRKTLVDGAEIDQAHDQPGQFKIIGAQKISRFEGLDSDIAWRLYEALKAHGIEAGIVDNPDGSRAVLAEFSPVCNYLVAEIVEDVLKKDYDFVGANRRLDS